MRCGRKVTLLLRVIWIAAILFISATYPSGVENSVMLQGSILGLKLSVLHRLVLEFSNSGFCDLGAMVVYPSRARMVRRIVRSVEPGSLENEWFDGGGSIALLSRASLKIFSSGICTHVHSW